MSTFIIQLLFGATVLLIVAIIVNTLFFRSAASSRYRIWTCTMLGLLLLPVLSPILPTTLSIGKPVANIATVIIPNHEPATNTETIIETQIASHEKQIERQIAAPPQVVANKFTFRYDYAFVIVWCFGTLVLLLHLAVSVINVRKMLATTQPITDPLLDELLREIGIKRPVRLAESETQKVPFICGITNPTIVLPPQAKDWTAAEKRAVLTHELAHVVRNDLLWQLVTQVGCAVYWFHPLVWFAAYRIWIERELACDDTVILRGEKPSIYADVLLDLASGLRKQKFILLGCTVAITRKNKVANRIKAILNPNIRRSPLGKIGTVVFVIFAVTAIIFTATISPFAQIEGENQAKIDLDAIASDPNSEQLTFKGTVLDPQGEPIDPRNNPVFITCNSLTLVKTQPWPGITEPNYSMASNNSTIGTNDATFEFARFVHPGTNVMVYACSSRIPRTMVSEPVVFVADKDRDDITIQMRQGILVRGTAMFDDGTPAVGRTISACKPLKLLTNLDINGNQWNFVQDLQATVQRDGKFELYLTPGTFIVGKSQYDTTQEITVSDNDANKDYHLDIVWPAPLRAKIVTEDGSTPGKLTKIVYSDDGNSTSCIQMGTNADETFDVDKKNGSFFVMLSEDGKLGAIHRVPDDKMGEIQTVVLKPTATLKMKLNDASGKPLPGERVTVSSGAWNNRSSSSAHLTEATSDANGVATIKLPPGTVGYRFHWKDEDYKTELTLTSDEVHELH